MSRKARSPDNARCEGFFGTLKSDFFGGRDWAGVTFEEFSRRLDAYIEWYRSEKVKKALGWKTIRRHREELGHAARLDVRKTSEVPWDGFKYSETRFVARLLAPRLPEPHDVCFAGLRLVAWGGVCAISWLCLSQQVPEPALSAGVSATVVSVLNNKLRVCVVLGVCVLWRRPSRAAMDAAHSQPREMRSPTCGYRLLGQTNCRQSVDCH